MKREKANLLKNTTCLPLKKSYNKESLMKFGRGTEEEQQFSTMRVIVYSAVKFLPHTKLTNYFGTMCLLLPVL